MFEDDDLFIVVYLKCRNCNPVYLLFFATFLFTLYVRRVDYVAKNSVFPRVSLDELVKLV